MAKIHLEYLKNPEMELLENHDVQHHNLGGKK